MEDYPTDASKEEIEIAETFLNKVLDLFDQTGNIEILRREEGTILDLQGCTSPGRLIGEEGSTLYAIQVLATLIICRKTQNPTNVIIDVNGYRARRRRQLEDMAWRAYDRVQGTGESVVLKPMNAGDRRVIHMTLSECEDIETFSIEEDVDTGMKCVQISLRDSEEFEEEEFADEALPEEAPDDEGYYEDKNNDDEVGEQS